MSLIMQEIYLITGFVFFLIVLLLSLNFYKIRLLSHSLKLCNWICGMAISSDSPWVKMFVLHIVFFVRVLMYLSIISLEHVDRLTPRSLFRHYISGSRVVLSEYKLAFMHSSEEVERRIDDLNLLNSQAKRHENQIRK